MGIDMGSFSIKIVELERKDERLHLANYALAQTKDEAVFKVGELKDFEVAEILKALLKQAEIKSRQASISLPVDKTFSTLIELPSMPEKELAAAIPYEAQKYVPVPLQEVVLDWSIVEVNPLPGAAAAPNQNLTEGPEVAQKPSGIQVLLVAVPKDIINKITRIAKMAGLELVALEQEAFSLVRSLVGNDKSIYLIVDLGRKGVDLIVVDQGFIRLSHNLESVSKEIILMEIDRVVSIYQMRYNKKVAACLLAGGRASEKELFDFLSAKLRIPLKLGDPFARLAHDALLEPALKELGPQMAIAVGLAMRDN